ncbi:MAG: hypothetical protein MR266_02815 [Erysipelotrichaceae bacterium]|nr:hypothetical protein [Erysipelotrichaceae bacterium]
MTLFESLKMFPKIDIHIDYFGSILKTTIEKLSNDFLSEEIEDTIDFNSLKDYSDYKSIVSKVLVNLKNIEIATTDLIEKLKKDNVMYGEIFINLDLFSKKLKKKDIILTILKSIKNSNLNLNLVLEIESRITKEEMFDDLNILYEFYNKGINGVYFKKNKQETFDMYQALFDKFIKDEIDYIVLLDSKLTNQNKEIYYNAKRIIYNLFEEPTDNFFNIIKNNEIILEFPITYQGTYHIYDELKNHFVYNLFKENVIVSFTTIDMTILDTDLLNEYCILFNVFPFNLHDLVNINLNILNKLNVSLEIKNNLISDFKEKANEILA